MNGWFVWLHGLGFTCDFEFQEVFGLHGSDGLMGWMTLDYVGGITYSKIPIVWDFGMKGWDGRRDC